MMLGLPNTVGVSPGTYTLQFNGAGLGDMDPTSSIDPSLSWPDDHQVGYYPNSLGDAGDPMTLFGVRLDILGVVAGVALVAAILFGKLAK